MPPSSTRQSRIRPFFVWITACVIAVAVLIYFGTHGIPRIHQDAFSHLRPPSSPQEGQTDAKIDYATNFTKPTHWTFDHRRHSKNYGLSEGQCLDAFPLLYDQVDQAVEYRRVLGHVTAQEVEAASHHDNTVRALIRKNELYIIEARGVWRDELRLRTLATLNSLNRAITSYRDYLPDIEFTLMIGDATPELSTWAYSRPVDEERVFLMPSFGFWASPSTGLRSYTEFRSVLENSKVDFPDKTPKLVWRGDTGSDVRKSLLRESEDQDWSAVKPVEWDWDNDRSIKDNLLATDDLCTFMFAATTEGNASIGRLEYLLNCNNVVMTHEPSRTEHFHHLLAPSGDYQNYIKLKRDFSDLRRTMNSMLETASLQNRAQLIADNARRMFRERYLTPAAEACYWRALIRGWGSIQGFQPQLWIESEEPAWHAGGAKRVKGRPRGMPFESYALMEATTWDVPPGNRHICVDG